MKESPSPRLRGIIAVLRAQKTAITRHQASELSEIAKDIEEYESSLGVKYAPIHLALSALLSSVQRTSMGIYRILDAEVFIWSLDELMKLTEPK